MPAPRRRRDQRGATALEMAMYMPLLLFVIFIAVQFALVYLGNQAASAVARQTARVARVTGDAGDAMAAGKRYQANIGGGVLEDAKITITPIGGDRVRVTVTGRAQEISPIGVPTVRETVEGPIEEFQEDE